MYRPSHRPSFRLRIFPSPFARRFGIKSAPFDNERYRNQGNKATEKRNRYQKVIICAGCPIFAYCGAILALPGAFSLVTAVRFLNGQKPFLLTTAAQNIHVFRRKAPLLKEHFFEWLKNSNFLNRLRKGHLEKSATAGGLCPSRSPTTAKTSAKVHLRLRFQNPGKPRTAGLCG